MMRAQRAADAPGGRRAGRPSRGSARRFTRDSAPGEGRPGTLALLGAAALALAGCFVPSVSHYAPIRPQPPGDSMVVVAPETFVIDDKVGLGLPMSLNGRIGVARGVDLGGRIGMGGARADVKVAVVRMRFLDVAVDPNAAWGVTTEARGGDDYEWFHSATFGAPLLIGLNALRHAGVVGNVGALWMMNRDADPFTSPSPRVDGAALHAGAGLSLRLGRKGSLHPEITAIRLLGQPGSPWMFQVGLGIGFGTNPYRDAGFDADPCPKAATSREGQWQVLGTACDLPAPAR